MSGLTLRLKAPAGTQFDLTGINPESLAGCSPYEIASRNVGIGKNPLTLADAFDISGANGDEMTIEGSGAALDFAGAGMKSGTLRIIGNTGFATGRKMTGGTIDVRGNAADNLASGMTGGTIIVNGNAGNNVGGLSPGDRFGMTGGTVVIEGNVGERAGDKMRRGTIVVRGKTGAGAGTRMIGGTIWAEGGFGQDPGLMMRRGTLIGPSVERLLPTFVDCGKHDLVIVRIIWCQLARALAERAPKAMPLFVRKIGGDMATIGRGEILLPAGDA